jgi:hypothetical protein
MKSSANSVSGLSRKPLHAILNRFSQGNCIDVVGGAVPVPADALKLQTVSLEQ